MSAHKEKILPQQKYKKWTLELQREKLPDCHHTNGFHPVNGQILSFGRVELDGEKLEFQDIRLYFSVPQS